MARTFFSSQRESLQKDRCAEKTRAPAKLPGKAPPFPVPAGAPARGPSQPPPSLRCEPDPLALRVLLYRMFWSPQVITSDRDLFQSRGTFPCVGAPVHQDMWRAVPPGCTPYTPDPGLRVEQVPRARQEHRWGCGPCCTLSSLLAIIGLVCRSPSPGSTLSQQTPCSVT